LRNRPVERRGRGRSFWPDGPTDEGAFHHRSTTLGSGGLAAGNRGRPARRHPSRSPRQLHGPGVYRQWALACGAGDVPSDRRSARQSAALVELRLLATCLLGGQRPVLVRAVVGADATSRTLGTQGDDAGAGVQHCHLVCHQHQLAELSGRINAGACGIGRRSRCAGVRQLRGRYVRRRSADPGSGAVTSRRSSETSG